MEALGRARNGEQESIPADLIKSGLSLQYPRRDSPVTIYRLTPEKDNKDVDYEGQYSDGRGGKQEHSGPCFQMLVEVVVE